MRANHLKWTVAIMLSLALPASSQTVPLKPRIVVLTDISPIQVEPDDFESMIRLLAHADLFEIEGLVATTGWSNGGGNERPDLIRQIIDAYEKDLPNLRKRSRQDRHLADESRQQVGYWPSPDYLRSRTVVGSRKMGHRFIGETNDSPGSDLIIKLADEKDERPIWAQAWGGGNTLAQAIWRIQKERTPEQFKALLKKIRFYSITDQDRRQRGGAAEESAHYWLRKEFSEDLVFLWDESAWLFQNGTGKRNWDEYATHIQGHGHLGAIYPKYKYGVEGDTPSFLYVLPNGLNDPENPGAGGWGGFFMRGTSADKTTQAYVNQPGTPAHPISRKYEARFYSAIFSDFAARMDWAKDGAGNRNPVVIVNGAGGLAPIVLTPAPGGSITLDASASRDPDGDQLKFSWWVLPEVGTCTSEVAISGSATSRATIAVPSEAAGKSIHVICEVTDDGTHNLTSYRRIVLKPVGSAIGSQPQKTSAIAKPRVVIVTDFPPTNVVMRGAPAHQCSDPDDVQSMVRFLLYANEFDVEGLVASSGTFANVANKTNLLDLLNLYDMVDENLRQHDPRYPTADQLRAVTYQGLTGTYGKSVSNNTRAGKDSEASEAIIKIVDKSDARPVWFCVWGDCANIAQAIWKVQNTRSAAELRTFLSKMRIHQIARQDETIDWLLKSFPDLFIIYSKTTYQGMFGGSDPISDLAWVNANIRHNHGPLGAVYPPAGMGCSGVCEGDSPSFLHLVSAVRGLNNPEDPTQPGWGGQFKRDGATSHYVDGPGRPSVSKWRAEVQADFARRMDWCVKRDSTK